MTARVTQAAKSATGRGESIALEMTDDAIAVETGGGIDTTKMGTDQRSAEGDRGRDQGTAITSANTPTEIDHGHAQENTEGTDQGVTSAGGRMTATDHRKIASKAAQEVQDGMRGVAIAVGAAAGHRTSTRSRAVKALIEL